MNIKNKMIEILNNLGNSITELDGETDIDLQEYIVDSLQFISFILSVEESFGIEFPDEMLQIENIKSLNAFCDIVECCVQKNESSIRVV